MSSSEDHQGPSNLKREREDPQNDRRVKRTKEEQCGLEQLPEELLSMIAGYLTKRKFCGDYIRWVPDLVALLNLMVCSRFMCKIIQPFYAAIHMSHVLMPLTARRREHIFFNQAGYTDYTRTLSIVIEERTVQDYVLEQKRLFQDGTAFPNIERLSLRMSRAALEANLLPPPDVLKNRKFKELNVVVQSSQPLGLFFDSVEPSWERNNNVKRNLESFLSVIHPHLTAFRYGESFQLSLCHKLEDLDVPGEYHNEIIKQSWPNLRIVNIAGSTEDQTDFFRRHPTITDLIDGEPSSRKEKVTDILPNLEHLECEGECLHDFVLPVSTTGKCRPLTTIRLRVDRLSGIIQVPPDVPLSTLTTLEIVAGFPTTECLSQLPPSITSMTLTSESDCSPPPRLPRLPRLTTITIHMSKMPDFDRVQALDEGDRVTRWKVIDWAKRWSGAIPSLHHLSILAPSDTRMSFDLLERQLKVEIEGETAFHVNWEKGFKWVKRGRDGLGECEY
ncbi:hypothetical protein PROFUN_03421 [Planoprotostelium fungivorum]|uniref:F-box domain-containing protein n=1 Tax=Planoprotostelium fungivorum TaxID=1890364 RepID=A0A2P6NWG9_9EUKA|nr:hypothetical protein PROFUN_03421 [Planoprotostelium fungivorum]